VLERVACPYCPKHFSRTVEYYKHVNHSHLPLIVLEWTQCNQVKGATTFSITTLSTKGSFATLSMTVSINDTQHNSF
jgi:hypothetical protein